MKEIPDELKGVLVRSEDTLHGAVRFAGTRVPVEVFLDTIADGWSLERTLASFPTIPLEAAKAVLDWQNSLAQSTLGVVA